MKALAVSADVLVLENEAGSMYKTLAAHADRVCGAMRCATCKMDKFYRGSDIGFH